MNKDPKIIQLVTPLEKFKEFNRVLDKTLTNLDHLSDMYIDLAFREKDIEDLNAKESDELREELKSHSQMILSLLHHPLIQVLNERRNTAEANNNYTEQLGYPTGCWQHYKGAVYEILDKVRSTDNRLDGVTYRLKDKPEAQIYQISLVNFYKLVNLDGRRVQRFIKLN